jgi:general secretion pathway protein G
MNALAWQAARLTRRRRDEGWTLIELLVVITIIMLLASMTLVQYRNSITAAKEGTLRGQLFIMRDAIDQYYADKGRYPESLQTLVSEQYLRDIPRDPMTESKDTWIIVPADPEPGNVSASAGIWDIKSGSDQVAIDGSRYQDW